MFKISVFNQEQRSQGDSYTYQVDDFKKKDIITNNFSTTDNIKDG